MATGQFNPIKLWFKIDLSSNPAGAGWGWLYIYIGLPRDVLIFPLWYVWFTDKRFLSYSLSILLLLLLFTNYSSSQQRYLMVFNWSLSDSNSPQVSRTLLSILSVLNNAVVWLVATLRPTSKSCSPFNNPLVTVPKAPITIGIIVTLMFHSFFQISSKVEVLILLFTFFQFYSVVSRDSKADNFVNSLFCWLLLGLVSWPRLGDPFLCQSPVGFYECYFLGQMLDCAYTIYSYGQIKISCTSPSGSPCRPNRI